jgi:hypothetical protein
MGMDAGLMQLFIKDIMGDSEFLGYKEAFIYGFLAENRMFDVFLYTLRVLAKLIWFF